MFSPRMFERNGKRSLREKTILNGSCSCRRVSELRMDVYVTKQVNATTGTPDLRGRIVKLAITCIPTTGHPCMLFKIEGNFKCKMDSHCNCTSLTV